MEVASFKVLKNLYKHDGDFNKICVECKNSVSKHFVVLEGYLFKGNCLCIHQGSLRKAIIFKAHSDGLGGHFKKYKTLVIIEDNFS